MLLELGLQDEQEVLLLPKQKGNHLGYATAYKTQSHLNALAWDDSTYTQVIMSYWEPVKEREGAVMIHMQALVCFILLILKKKKSLLRGEEA